MDRERQEPTFGTPELGAPDLQELRFRSDRARYVPQREPMPTWAYIAGGIVLAIVIIMGLIEWNARRQAAAISAELTRPMNKAEQARFDAQKAKWVAEEEALIREYRRYIDRPITLRPQPIPIAPAPLRNGQRCIGGKRFERIDGGWRDLPHDPC